MTDPLGLASAELPGPDEAAAAAVRSRAAHVIRPPGALARLDEVAVWLGAWQRTSRPAVSRPAAVIFVADHGVADEGVSAFPAAITAHMLRALRSGAATAAVMAAEVGARLEVVDVGTGRPTGNLAREAALDEARFAEALSAGARAVAGLDTDLLVLGEMGIANTTAAAAVCAALYGGPAELWTGRGTGVDDDTYALKVGVVERAVARVGEGCGPMEVLRELGGSELAAIAGAVLEARRCSIPVLLDGFVVTAAACVLDHARPGALAHCLAAHRSAEPGHAAVLSKLGLEPLLDLGLRLGEGSGALAAIPLVRLAAACVNDVSTFEEWGM